MILAKPRTGLPSGKPGGPKNRGDRTPYVPGKAYVFPVGNKDNKMSLIDWVGRKMRGED